MFPADVLKTMPLYNNSVPKIIDEMAIILKKNIEKIFGFVFFIELDEYTLPGK